MRQIILDVSSGYTGLLNENLGWERYKLVAAGLLEIKGGKHFLTDAGKSAGGEFRVSKKFGPYFLWPESFTV